MTYTLKDCGQGYNLKYKGHCETIPRSDGEGIVIDHDASILLARGGKDIKVGYMNATLYLGTEGDQNPYGNDGIITVADAIDQETYEVAEELYGKGSAIRAELEQRALCWHKDQNALYINSIWIHPKHRGRDLGLRAILSACRLIGSGCSIIVLRAWAFVRDPKTHRTTVQRVHNPELQSYYGRTGFVPVGQGQFMFLDRLLKQDVQGDY